MFAFRKKRALKMTNGRGHAYSDSDDLELPSNRSKGESSKSKFWSALGTLYVILGVVQIVLSALWHWWFLGTFIGVGITKLGSSLIGLGVTGGVQSPLPPSPSLVALFKHFILSIILWGSLKIQRLVWQLRWLIFLYGGIVALCITIHMSSPDPHVGTFPENCTPEKRFGCSRVALENSRFNHKLEPLIFESPLEDVQLAAQQWIEAQPNTHILYSTTGFVHSRFVTMVFGFADDFMISFHCDEEQRTVVEVQGQLRIGKSDLGVNYRRNKRFSAALSETALPIGKCSSSAAASQIAAQEKKGSVKN